MGLLPPHPTAVTSKDVARAMEWAWTLKRQGKPLSDDGAAAITWVAIYLQTTYPLQAKAVLERSFAIRAEMSVEEWLRAFGRASSTHHRNWAKGCKRIAERINVAQGRGDFNKLGDFDGYRLLTVRTRA